MADSVVSTQTSYPDSPDTSLQAYYKAMDYSGHGRSRNALSRWFHSTFGSDPTYNQWRAEQRDQYNADLNAYNSYISSLVGQRAQAEEAGYNPAWLGSDAGGGTSPLDYQQPQDPGENPMSEMLQGINTFMSLAAGVQNIKSLALKNQLLGQEINGAAWDNVLKGQQAKYGDRYYGFRAYKMGFQSDFAKLIYGNELNSRLAGSNLDGTLFQDYTAPGLSNTYEISPEVRKGFNYQDQFNEVELKKATVQWRKYQSEVAHWSGEERKYYNQVVQPILKEYWEGKKDYQSTVNALYEAQKKNEMDNRTANTVTRVVLGLVSIVSRFLGVPLNLSGLVADPSTGEILPFN